jgi:hypothetical protein
MRQILIMVLTGIFLLGGNGLAADNIMDLFDTVLGGGRDGELTEETIIQGLLEALKVGAENAVISVSKLDGYLANEMIRVPLPEHIKNAEELIRMVGRGDLVDDFVKSMNRAAEKAAPEARELFGDAIREITFDDARKILQGKDNEATLYFQDKMSDTLIERFLPLVEESLEKTEVTRHYRSLERSVSNLPITIEGITDFKLEDYVTQKALDGLFRMLAEEERKIRNDPTARVSDILEIVFGQRD